MILKQYYLNCLAQASYLIGCETSNQAVVVDPRRDVDDYVADAEAKGLTITQVILTHFHADFLSGHLELRARTGATIRFGSRAQTEFESQPLQDGETIELGPTARIEVRETPGHTPESISLVVYDLAKAPETPHAVLTGDTLFIGDVGRPDLLASVGVTAEELADQLYDSLHTKLLTLPDETLLYPGHGAGSLCGKSLSSETVCTIGRQRRTNYALQIEGKDAFREAVTSGQTRAPGYFVFDAVLNRKQRPTLGEALQRELTPLALDEVVRLENQGVVVLDVRDPHEFARRHLARSINVGIDGKYATWAGSVVAPEQRIVMIAPPGREREAIVRLGRIGFDTVVGYLEGGIAALEGRDDLAASIERWDATRLAKALEQDAPRLLDVRNPGETEHGVIRGSQTIPLGELSERADEVPRDAPLVVVCGSGYRSIIAASLLARGGVAAADLVGGYNAWQARG